MALGLALAQAATALAQMKTAPVEVPVVSAQPIAGSAVPAPSFLGSVADAYRLTLVSLLTPARFATTDRAAPYTSRGAAATSIAGRGELMNHKARAIATALGDEKPAEYTPMSGTSMASPLAPAKAKEAPVARRLEAGEPELEPAEILKRLSNSPAYQKDPIRLTPPETPTGKISGLLDPDGAIRDRFKGIPGVVRVTAARQLDSNGDSMGMLFETGRTEVMVTFSSPEALVVARGRLRRELLALRPRGFAVEWQVTAEAAARRKQELEDGHRAALMSIEGVESVGMEPVLREAFPTAMMYPTGRSRFVVRFRDAATRDANRRRVPRRLPAIDGLNTTAPYEVRVDGLLADRRR